jgi:hypothetical protein
MQPGPANLGKPAIENLAVERMLEIVVRRNVAIDKLVNAGEADEQLPFRQTLANLLNFGRIQFRRVVDGPQ